VLITRLICHPLSVVEVGHFSVVDFDFGHRSAIHNDISILLKYKHAKLARLQEVQNLVLMHVK